MGLSTRAQGCVAMLLLVGGLALFALLWMGSVWVVDPAYKVSLVYLGNSRAAEKLTPVPTGRYFALADYDASITVVCKDGTRFTDGYVSPSVGGTFTVKDDCSGFARD